MSVDRLGSTEGIIVALSPDSPRIRKGNADQHEARVRVLMDGLKSGAFPSAAANAAGITSATLGRWVKAGERLIVLMEQVESDPNDHREPSVSELELIWLTKAVREAEGRAEINLGARVREAAEDDWRAASWLLERRFKENWSKRSEVTGADGGALQVETGVTGRQRALDALEVIAQRLEEQERARLEDEASRAEVVPIRPAIEGEGVGEGEGSGGVAG